MRNHNVKANDIYRWIEQYMRGNSTDYFLAKEDTSDAIVIFQSLLYKTFGSCVDMMEYLIDRLDLSGAMPPNDSEYARNSYYRAFLSLYNDSAVNFRLSRHNATESSTEKGWARDGEPDVQYNLILEKVESTSKNPQITNSTLFHGVWVEVCHISLSDFNDDGNKRWEFIRKVVNYLTYGKPFNNESKTTKNMKTNKIRLTESQLRHMIAEAVEECMDEGVLGSTMRGAYNNGRYGKDADQPHWRDLTPKNLANYVKGNDNEKTREWYNNHMNWYNQAKADLKQGNGINPISKREDGAYSNYPDKAYQQNYVDGEAAQALDYKPGFGGKVARAASIPLQLGANLAGRIAKRFGGKQVSETQMYDEIMEMINESIR